MASPDSPEPFATREQAHDVHDEIDRVLGQITMVETTLNISPYKGANLRGFSLTMFEFGRVHPHDPNSLLMATAMPIEPIGDPPRNVQFGVEKDQEGRLLLAKYVTRPKTIPHQKSSESNVPAELALTVDAIIEIAEAQTSAGVGLEHVLGMHRATMSEAAGLLVKLGDMPVASPDGSNW